MSTTSIIIICITQFALLLTIILWSFVIMARFAKLEKQALTHKKLTALLYSASTIASEAEKNSINDRNKEKFHQLYLMFQMLYDSCKSPNVK